MDSKSSMRFLDVITFREAREIVVPTVIDTLGLLLMDNVLGVLMGLGESGETIVFVPIRRNGEFLLGDESDSTEL